MNKPETPQTPNEIGVWDPLVRIFHWSLAMTFAVAWLSGDEESPLHIYSGYAVIGLVLIRIVWGFVGTRYARFSDFVHRPATILAYAKDLLAGKSKRYLGHNPLGGAMINALLAAGVTGLVLQGAQDGTGPFAALSASATAIVPGAVANALADDDQAEGENEGAEEVWQELHEFFANLALLLVVLHIAGVIIGSLVHRENLVRAMFTGRKSV